MRIILLRDVPGTGRSGDVKNVADGYGRNYLIPKKLAVLATPDQLKQVEQLRQNAVKQEARERAELEQLAAKIADLTLTVHHRAGEQGRLFGSVTAPHIAQEISQAVGQSIDRRTIELEHPIREVGTYSVSVRLTHDLEPKLTLVVAPEET